MMKKKLTCVLYYSLAATIMAVSISCGCNDRILKRKITHNTKVIWLDTTTEKVPLTYMCPGRYDDKDELQCVFRSSLHKGAVQYIVISGNDTVEFEISQTYIQTNTDSINILINWATDTSSIYVMPNSAWAFNKRIMVKGGIMNDYCSIKTTRPVHVAVYIIVDFMDENKNKSIYDLIEDEKKREMDSIIRNAFNDN